MPSTAIRCGPVVSATSCPGRIFPTSPFSFLTTGRANPYRFGSPKSAVLNDDVLADRLRKLLACRRKFTEKKMFGGTGFLLNGNVCCGAWREFLILRLGDDAARQVLSEPDARPFDITG